MKNPRNTGGTVASIRAAHLAKLDAERSNILAEADRFFGEMEFPDTRIIIALLTLVKKFFGAALKGFDKLLEQFSGHRNKRGEYFRQVQLDSGVSAPHVPQSWTKTLMLPQITATSEALLVGGLMIIGGHMDVIAGYSYAAIFALANVLVGMMAGYFGLRYAVLKSGAEDLSPQDLKTRRLGKALFAGMLGLLALMIFVAGRVRATGGHESVFDFSTVSFFGTYNDGMAIMITVIACASSFIAIIEGYKIDPVVGLSKAYRYANAIDADVDTLVDGTRNTVDARLSPLDQAYEALDAIDAAEKSRKEGLPRINDLRRNFNGKVDAAKNALIVAAQKDVARYRQITGESMDVSPNLGLEAFNKLKLPLISDTDIQGVEPDIQNSVSELRALVSDIEVLHQDALAQIDAAHTSYLATRPNLSPVTKPEGVPS